MKMHYQFRVFVSKKVNQFDKTLERFNSKSAANQSITGDMYVFMSQTMFRWGNNERL